MKLVLGFSLLCLLWSVEWLREPLAIFPTPSLLRSAISCTLAALILATTRSGRNRPDIWRSVWSVALLAAPVLLLSWAKVSSYTVPVLWTLTPLFIVVLSTANPENQGLRFDRLVACCFGSAGSLLIFPFQLPGSANEVLGWLLVLLAIASAAMGSIYARQVPATDLAVPAAVLWAAALLSGSSAISLDRYQISWTALIDVPALLILLWLLDQLPPERLAARYFLPLVGTIVSSGLVLRQTPSIRLLFGVMMLLGASLYLFLERSHDAAPPNFLLHDPKDADIA